LRDDGAPRCGVLLWVNVPAGDDRHHQPPRSSPSLWPRYPDLLVSDLRRLLVGLGGRRVPALEGERRS